MVLGGAAYRAGALLRKRQRKDDGAYEGSNCRTSDRKNGELIAQGNFIFYFNGFECYIEVIAKRKPTYGNTLILSKVFADPSYGECSTVVLKHKGSKKK